MGCIHLDRMRINTIHNHTYALHCLQQDIRVPHVRHIFYQNCFISHNRSCQYGKRRILAPPISTSPTSGFPPSTTYCSILTSLCMQAAYQILSFETVPYNTNIPILLTIFVNCRLCAAYTACLNIYRYELLLSVLNSLCKTRLVKSDIQIFDYYTIYTKLLPLNNPKSDYIIFFYFVNE